MKNNNKIKSTKSTTNDDERISVSLNPENTKELQAIALELGSSKTKTAKYCLSKYLEEQKMLKSLQGTNRYLVSSGIVSSLIDRLRAEKPYGLNKVQETIAYEAIAHLEEYCESVRDMSKYVETLI